MLVTLGMAAFFFAWLLQLLISQQHSESGLATSGIAALVVSFPVFVGPWLLAAWRIAKTGLWLGSDGIAIRGPIRTWRITPSEAVSFSPGVTGGGNGTPCPTLALANGRTVGVWALGREGVIWNFDNYLEELQPLCDRLNELLEELYPAHPLPALSRPDQPRGRG